MLKLMRYLLLILFIFSGLATAAEVYKSVDENGNVIFSDKPSQDAEKIDVEGIQTVDSPGVKPFKYTPPKDNSGAWVYKDVKITTPTEGDFIRDNTGSVNISASVAPALNTALGHHVEILMDGNKVGSGLQASLTNVDRGTHSVTAVVKDREGKELASSAPVSFTMYRESANFKKK